MCLAKCTVALNRFVVRRLINAVFSVNCSQNEVACGVCDVGSGCFL